MKQLAILGNGNSSQITDRTELVELLHKMNIQPYSGRVMDGTVNEYYSPETAIFIPIIASRSNTNPLNEIKSLLSVAGQIKKYKIDAVIIYGVKNHSAMAIGSKLGGANRILCVVNGSGNLFRISGLKGIIIRFMAFPMLRIAYRFSTSVCFQNRDDLEMFKQKRLINNSCDAFITGGSGVNLGLFPKSPLPKDIRFLFLSRITATKGLKEYCEAARIVKNKYPNAVFDIVGPLDATVEKNIIKRILDSAVEERIVNYRGFTNQVSAWMQLCRFFVYPSYYPEGIPRCVLQALSTGRPIITCNTPGCKETVINGVNGFIVPEKDSIALADKMIWMIEHPLEVEKMGEQSRALAEAKFDVNEINKLLLKQMSK